MLYLICGHGAGDPGAGGGGENEAENVRRLAQRVKALAKDQSQVQIHDMSRNAYASKDLATLNVPKGAQVLELHRDSSNGGARGAHVIIKNGYKADDFDTKLARNLAKIFPGRSNIVVGRDNLYNVNMAAKRGINYRLAEVGFIDNVTDREIFNTRLDDIALAILDAAGIPAAGGQAAGWVSEGGRWWYRRADGTYPKGGWAQIGGRWYAFDSSGWMLTGWYHPGRGEWYWLDASGAMVTGWQKVGGSWYYFEPRAQNGLKEGQMAADAWRKDSKGKDFWLSGDGSMATSRWVDRARYRVGADGAWDGAE